MAGVASKVTSATDRERGREPDLRALECVVCSRLYSKADARSGRYRLETMVCSFCYADLQAAPYAKSCFGKPTVKNALGVVVERGYESDAVECSQLCPDAEVCERIFR